MITKPRSKVRALRIFGATIVASLAVSAIAVASASAFEWEVNGVTFAESKTVSETFSPAIRPGTDFTLESKVLGESFKLKAAKVSGESTVITPGGKASGFLVLSELTVVEPVSCKVTSPIKTKALKSELVEVGGTLYDKFQPAEGENIANIKITDCGAAEVYPLKGAIYARTAPLSTQLITQPLTFSEAINRAGGGTLKLGAEPAVLGGEAVTTLTGPNAGKVWGARASGSPPPPPPGPFEWEVEGKTFSESGTISETFRPAIKTGADLALEWTMLGTRFKVDIREFSGESTVITPGGKASGSYVFSGLTTVEPSGCNVESPIKTKTLKSELVEVGGTLYDKFQPKEGETLFNLTITGCAAGGTYPIKGSVFALTEKLGVQIVSQPLTFSKAINEAAGGTLKLGKEPVVLSGEAVTTLTGPSAGKIWGAK